MPGDGKSATARVSPGAAAAGGLVLGLVIGGLASLWSGCLPAADLIARVQPAPHTGAHAAGGGSSGGGGGGEAQPECVGGYWTGPKQALWHHVDSDDRPKLVDLLENNGTVYALFTYKTVSPNGPVHMTNHGRERQPWTFTFHAGGSGGASGGGGNITVNATSNGRSPHGHTLVVQAPLPPALAAGWDRGRSINVTLETSGAAPTAYEHYPLCLSPANAPTWQFAHCTQTLVEDQVLKTMPEWLAHHALIGFNHTFVYANGPPQMARERLAPWVRAGLVTIVDWHTPPRFKNWFLFQQGQEMSCILRARSRVAWLLMHDSDEFMQPMRPGADVAAVVSEVCGGGPPPGGADVTSGAVGWGTCSGTGALQLKSWVFGMAANASAQAVLNASAGDSVLRLLRYQTRAGSFVAGGSEKLLVRPLNVRYFSVHMLTAGGATVSINPEKVARSAHFQRPGQVLHPTHDGSLAALVPQIDAYLKAIEAGKPLPFRSFANASN